MYDKLMDEGVAHHGEIFMQKGTPASVTRRRMFSRMRRNLAGSPGWITFRSARAPLLQVPYPIPTEAPHRRKRQWLVFPAGTLGGEINEP